MAECAPVQPVEAWAAMSPDRGITQATTRGINEQEAAILLGITQRGREHGWRVIRVRIVPVEDGDG